MSGEIDPWRRIVGLENHPGWADLVAYAGEERTKVEQALTKRALSVDPIDQRYFDERRGYLLGIQWVLAAPELAARKVKRQEGTNE